MQKTSVDVFAIEFVKSFGAFVKKQTTIAKSNGLNKDEINAIIATTCKLVGRNADEFKKRAGLN